MAMWLTIRSGEQRGLVAAVDGKPFLLGRGEECDLTVSRCLDVRAVHTAQTRTMKSRNPVAEPVCCRPR